jgi:Phage protein Gp138 N-terminal domain
MSLQNNPILNGYPGDQSFSNLMKGLMDLHSQRNDKMIPAQVVSYDRTSNTATVKPMIMLVDTNNNTTSRNQIANVPVVSLGGGGFHINFPLKAGDLGWIMAADRDISLYVKNLAESRPTTNRKHRFADSWFIPDVMRKYTINGADSSAMVIQSTDGATRISVFSDHVEITAPSNVKIDTPTTTITGDVIIQKTLTVNSNTVLKANQTITGLLAVNGGFNATGGGNQPCVLPQSTTIGGIGVYGHGHIETNNAGGRTSGGMVI